MPIYEYLCEGCSYKFEVKQSMKDDPIATCERCGQSVKRLISSPAIMFKGSGWYVTDYSDKLKPPSEGDKAGASSGDKKESTTPAAPAGTTTANAPASTPSTAATTTTASPSSPPTSTSTSTK